MRIAIKYTLIAVLVTIIWTMFEHFMGYNTTNHEVGQYTRFAMTIIFWGFIVSAILRMKTSCNGNMSFRQGLNTGAAVAIGYSLLISIWFAAYAEVINRDYQRTLMDFEKNKMIAKGASPEKITEKLKQVELQSGGSVQSYLMLFLYMALFGLGVALITTAIVKTRRRKRA